MQQLEKNNQYNFSLSIGGKNVFSRENISPAELLNVEVFASHPDFPAQPGYIRNLVIETAETLDSRSGIRNSPCPSGCILNYQITWSTFHRSCRHLWSPWSRFSAWLCGDRAPPPRPSPPRRACRLPLLLLLLCLPQQVQENRGKRSCTWPWPRNASGRDQFKRNAARDGRCSWPDWFIWLPVSRLRKSQHPILKFLK